jgi:hypothetical protein
VDYQDWAVLVEFNMLVNKYTNMEENIKNGSVAEVPRLAQYNFIGMPYIALDKGYAELKFYAPKEEIDSNDPDILLKKFREYSRKMQSEIISSQKQLMSTIDSLAQNSGSLNPILGDSAYMAEAPCVQSNAEESLVNQSQFPQSSPLWSLTEGSGNDDSFFVKTTYPGSLLDRAFNGDLQGRYGE